MGIDLDDPLWSIEGSVVQTPRSRADQRRQSGGSPEQRVPAGERPEGDPARIDPLILEAMKEWPGRLELDDLDMSKWLAGEMDVPEREAE